MKACLPEESLDDLLLGFLLVETESHELGDLLTRDLTDGSFMDQRSIDACSLELRSCDDNTLVHDDGITLGMALASCIAGDVDDDILLGFALGNATAYDIADGTIAVEGNFDLSLCRLVEVCEDLVMHDQSGVCTDLSLCDPVCIVDSGDLRGIHFHGGTFFEIYNGCGVHESLARTGTFAVMLLDVLYLGILTDMEGVDTVVLTVQTAAIADSASCYDDNITILTDEEIVINALLVAGLGDDYRDMAGFVLRAVLEVDVDAIAGFSGLDLDIGCGISGLARTVASDVERTDRKTV